MKANWTKNQIGMPVRWKGYESIGVIKSYVEYDDGRKDVYVSHYDHAKNLDDIDIDIKFIFQMLDSAGYGWVNWITYDLKAGWFGAEIESRIWGHRWLIPIVRIWFPYFKSPYPWQKSKWQRPDQ